MLETIIGSFIIIVIAALALSVGQWFGRRPIAGRCSPDDPACCRNQRTPGCDKPRDAY